MTKIIQGLGSKYTARVGLPNTNSFSVGILCTQ